MPLRDWIPNLGELKKTPAILILENVVAVFVSIIGGVAGAEYVSPDSRLGYLIVMLGVAFSLVLLYASAGLARRAWPSSPSVQTSAHDLETFAVVRPFDGIFLRKRTLNSFNVEEIVFEVVGKRALREVRVSLDYREFEASISGWSYTSDRIDLSNTKGRSFDMHVGETRLLIVHTYVVDRKLGFWGSLPDIGQIIPAHIRTKLGSTYFVRLRVAHANGHAITYPFEFVIRDGVVVAREAVDDGNEVKRKTADARTG